MATAKWQATCCAHCSASAKNFELCEIATTGLPRHFKATLSEHCTRASVKSMGPIPLHRFTLLGQLFDQRHAMQRQKAHTTTKVLPRWNALLPSHRCVPRCSCICQAAVTMQWHYQRGTRDGADAAVAPCYFGRPRLPAIRRRCSAAGTATVALHTLHTQHTWRRPMRRVGTLGGADARSGTELCKHGDLQLSGGQGVATAPPH